VTFSVAPGLDGVPLICYEVIYPGFVRSRVGMSANVLLSITNDGWFGRSPGPFHHAAMARLRTIENGISMVRCANTGMSMIVDQYGRVLGRTRLFEKAVLTRDVPVGRVWTPYSVFGDWVVLVSLLVVLGAVVAAVCGRLRGSDQ
jgi:apolipoprotein N-acyltransferase